MGDMFEELVTLIEGKSVQFLRFRHHIKDVDVGFVFALCNQLYRLHFAHQFLAQMLEAKVSWLLCIGRLVSKTDNVMHLLHMLGKTSK